MRLVGCHYYWKQAALLAALAEVNALAEELDGYHLFHVIRGELLLELSYREQGRAAALRALQLTQNRAEQALLTRKLLE
ncbi:MAG: hypothetical protein ACXWQR_08685 [Ktedonobacterales bacterium]